MSKFKGRFLDSLDLQLMSSLYLVLACMFYSARGYDTHQTVKIGLVNAVFKYHTTAWQAFEGKRDFGRERNAKGGGGVRREGGKGLQGGHYFCVINIHQRNVKILIGQFSKHVNHGLDT